MTGKAKNVTFYGFDQIGFTIPNKILKVDDIFIHFVGFRDQLNLEDSDGVIIPQGIFEKFTPHQDYFGDWYTNVHVLKDLILEREKQVFNLLKEGKWVCFLIREIVDFVPQKYDKQNVSDTDLCKKILNAFDVKRNKIEADTFLESKQIEFNNYIKRYGVAKMVFFPKGTIEKKVLVMSGNEAAGLELVNKLFILPFHTTDTTLANLEALAKILPMSIEDYRQKRSDDLPPWLNEFKFASEDVIEKEIEAHFKRVAELETELDNWASYKGVLTTQGDVLKKKVIRILEEFFGLKIDPLDELREDAKILSDDGKSILALIEIKGTKKGVSREFINQVDSHRENNGLDSTMPGVLIINNQMDLPSVEDRLKTKVEEEHIKHAKNNNVLVIRAIDLLLFVHKLESATDRKSVFLKHINSGGGLFKIDL